MRRLTNDTRDKPRSTNLSFRVIERDEERRLANVNVEGRIYYFDLPQIEHSAQGGVIASAAIVLDDRRRVLVTSAARKAAAALQSAVWRRR